MVEKTEINDIYSIDESIELSKGSFESEFSHVPPNSKESDLFNTPMKDIDPSDSLFPGGFTNDDPNLGENYTNNAEPIIPLSLSDGLKIDDASLVEKIGDTIDSGAPLFPNQDSINNKVDPFEKYDNNVNPDVALSLSNTTINDNADLDKKVADNINPDDSLFSGIDPTKGTDDLFKKPINNDDPSVALPLPNSSSDEIPNLFKDMGKDMGDGNISTLLFPIADGMKNKPAEIKADEPLTFLERITQVAFNNKKYIILPIVAAVLAFGPSSYKKGVLKAYNIASKEISGVMSYCKNRAMILYDKNEVKVDNNDKSSTKMSPTEREKFVALVTDLSAKIDSSNLTKTSLIRRVNRLSEDIVKGDLSANKITVMKSNKGGKWSISAFDTKHYNIDILSKTNSLMNIYKGIIFEDSICRANLSYIKNSKPVGGTKIDNALQISSNNVESFIGNYLVKHVNGKIDVVQGSCNNSDIYLNIDGKIKKLVNGKSDGIEDAASVGRILVNKGKKVDRKDIENLVNNLAYGEIKYGHKKKTVAFGYTKDSSVVYLVSGYGSLSGIQSTMASLPGIYCAVECASGELNKNLDQFATVVGPLPNVTSGKSNYSKKLNVGSALNISTKR